MKYSDQVYDAWLASAEIPYEWLIPLLCEKENSEAVYSDLILRRLPLENMIPAVSREKLRARSGDEYLQNLDLLLKKHEIRSITVNDAMYPDSLRRISDPPGILFYQGNISCLTTEKTVAMIGSRAASYAGQRASRKIARELSLRGVTVISGLAYGIDSECHRGCIEGKSPTIAVMGCGLDQTYPIQNEQLKRDILSGNGMILSEYSPGSRPIGHHFPVRNRIISGMADAVILMEAKIRSGSMTTITHALNQGKEVFAYPGDPVSPMSEANRILLREGARFFTTAEDILTDMNWLDNLPPLGQNSDCSQRLPDEPDEAAVYRTLQRGPLGFDELLQATGLKSSTLMSILTIMQIKREIEPLPGKKYKLLQA